MGMLDDAALPDRYEHNPMLAVLENFILAAIDALAPEDEKKLAEIVNRTFGGTDWKKTIRDQFGMPPDADAQFRTAWKQRLEEAEMIQEECPPEQFAREVADDIVADTGN
jgi:hypothetical protein